MPDLLSHNLVDTEAVTMAKRKGGSAALPDREGGTVLLAAAELKERFPRLQLLWAVGYRGKCVAWVQATTGWPDGGRQALVGGCARLLGGARPGSFRHSSGIRGAEAALTWGSGPWRDFSRYRRLSKDEEFLPTSSEALIYGAMRGLLLKRLAKKVMA